jgi:hypothetical protein
MRYLRVDGYVAPDSCLRTSGHSQPLPAVERMSSRRLEACATGSLRQGECLQLGLTQRDMWVMRRYNSGGFHWLQRRQV